MCITLEVIPVWRIISSGLPLFSGACFQNGKGGWESWFFVLLLPVFECSLKGFMAISIFLFSAWVSAFMIWPCKNRTDAHPKMKGDVNRMWITGVQLRQSI